MTVTATSLVGSLYRGTDNTKDSWATICARHAADANGDKSVSQNEADAFVRRYNRDDQPQTLSARELTSAYNDFLEASVNTRGWGDATAKYNTSLYHKGYGEIANSEPPQMMALNNEFTGEPATYVYNPKTQAFSLPLNVDFGAGEVNTVLSTALQLVAMFPPEGSSVLGLTDPNRATYAKANIAVVTSTTRETQDAFGIPEANSNADAFTIVLASNGQPMIAAVALHDRLFFDERGVERSDKLARATVALAHELYGNTTELADKIGKGTYMQPIDRVNSEINAFQHGIAYLERLIASELFTKFPATAQASFRTALQNEKAGLAWWEAQK